MGSWRCDDEGKVMDWCIFGVFIAAWVGTCVALEFFEGNEDKWQ